MHSRRALLWTVAALRMHSRVVTTPTADALAELLEHLASLPHLGGWVTAAACRGEAELFTAYPASKTAASKVAAICDRCPVRETCEQYAGRYDVDGVWAGTWHNTSTGTATVPAQARAVVQCGTYGGYRRHRRQGEASCDPCLAANAAQASRYKQQPRPPED